MVVGFAVSVPVEHAIGRFCGERIIAVTKPSPMP